MQQTWEDVRARLDKARTAFRILKKVWSSREIGKSTKLMIFNTTVKSVLLYGSEIWRMTQSTLHKLPPFINSCLSKILCMRWPEEISNEDLWRAADQKPVATQIRRRKLSWIGHNQPATLPGRHWPGIHRGKERAEEPGHVAQRHQGRSAWKRSLLGDSPQSGALAVLLMAYASHRAKGLSNTLLPCQSDSVRGNQKDGLR